MLAELPSSDELLQAALEYARIGLPVFPCFTPINGVCDCPKGPACGKNTGKHPRTVNGHKDATTNELKIRGWWRDFPIANIGLALPEGYVAVDVDGDHGYQRLLDDGKRLPTTATQTSGRGYHYVYRTREHIGPRTLIEPSGEGAHDGIDLRGPGGYIMVAPSVHQSGRVYEWSVPLSQIEVAPDWLENVNQQRSPGIGQKAPVDFNRVLAGLPEGSRKRELYRAACKARGAGVPIEWAISLALESAANCNPPLEAWQAERKVREAYAKFPVNAVASEQEAGVTLLGLDSVMVEFETCRFVFTDMEKAGRELRAEMEVETLLPGFQREPYSQSLNLLSVSARDQVRREMEKVLGDEPKGQWTSLLSRAVTKAKDAFLNIDRSISTADMTPPEILEFIIPDICVADGINILFGNGSGGKTWLLMWAALCVSLGIPYLGRPTKRLKVLYVDCETGQSTYAYRMRRLCEAVGLTLADAGDIRFWNGKGVPFADQVAAIKRTCDEHEIGLICLDHLAAACGGDANEQSIASALANAVGKIGLPVLALAHVTGADMRNPEAVDKPFGCHSADTEILTERGWITHDQWIPGEQIMGYDPTSERLCWTTPAVLHAYEYEGDLLHFRQGSAEALVTPSHRMYVKPHWPERPNAAARRPRFKPEWQVIPADQLKSSKWLVPYAPPLESDIWTDRDEYDGLFLADALYEPEPFMRLLGWWIAEGSIQDGGLGLCQAEGDLADRMKATLDELKIDYWSQTRKWTEATRPHEQAVCYIRTRKSGPLTRWMAQHAGRGAASKRIPDMVWAMPLKWKAILLDALIEGDGNLKPSGRATYHTISRQLADDVQRLAIEIGRGASVRRDPPGRKGAHDRYEVKIGRPGRDTLVLRTERHVKPVPYSGMVYCFTVATDAYLTRRNGRTFISGNSIFWHNNARRTTFVLRQQEAESSLAELGLYPKKVNDGIWPAPYAARIEFNDPSGPVVIGTGDLRANRVLSAVRGLEHAIWDLLATPMLAEEIAAATGKSERTCKDEMKAHPAMFVELTAGGGRGQKSRWARVETRLPYEDDDEYVEDELPF